MRLRAAVGRAEAEVGEAGEKKLQLQKVAARAKVAMMTSQEERAKEREDAMMSLAAKGVRGETTTITTNLRRFGRGRRVVARAKDVLTATTTTNHHRFDRAKVKGDLTVMTITTMNHLRFDRKAVVRPRAKGKGKAAKIGIRVARRRPTLLR